MFGHIILTIHKQLIYSSHIETNVSDIFVVEFNYVQVWVEYSVAQSAAKISFRLSTSLYRNTDCQVLHPTDKQNGGRLTEISVFSCWFSK
jgi:hypothetical protein